TRYAYITNDPLDRIDPLGLDAFDLAPMFSNLNGGFDLDGRLQIVAQLPTPQAGWHSAIASGIEWGTGHNGGDTINGPESPFSQDMKDSSIAASLRNYFKNKN